MNKQLYRLIFNAARGQLMAVAESASSHSRGDARVRRQRAALDPAGAAPNFTPHPLALAALLFLTCTVGLVDIAQAQILGDPNAPGNLRPVIGVAGNGVPVVNIQAPSAAGVSRNVYRQFDVQTNGAILNNARSNTQTQLGGWIAGNPQLVGNTARVILNEVYSSDPSSLRGYIEVAGDKAQVVIANPAGITCDGCGFINADRATLTTGTPILNGGNLDGYRVVGGQIRIEGAGLDGTRTDYTDLIARSVQINAGLWANTLKITTGANQVDVANTTATPITGSGAAPAYAVDVAQLGGMYAGKIHLVGTEAGLGMRNAGEIGASAGDVVITVDGQITNSGRVAAQGLLHLGAADLDNRVSGQITATAATLDIGNTATNRGLIDAGATRLVAGNLNNLGTGRIYGDDLAIMATTLTNDAEAGSSPVIAARNRLDLGVTTLNNREGAILFSTGDLAIGGSLDGNGHAAGQANTVNNQSASIEALGNLSLAAQSINNTNAHFSTTVDTTTSSHTEYLGSGSNTRYEAGTPGVYTFYDESLHLHTPENPYIETWYAYSYTRTTSIPRVLTSAPAQILAGGNMNLSGGTLLNDQSQIVAGGALVASLASLTNTDAQAQRSITDSGSVTSYWRDYQKGQDSTGSSTIAYSPAPTIQSINLSPTAFQQNTQPSGSIAAPTLPSNALFPQNPSPTAHFLIESDPRLTHYRTWISSDSLLQQLSIDPATAQKRLGDGFYEQKLLREQVAQLTGRRFLDGYASDEAQYRALMSGAVTVAQSWHLIPGVALSPAQIAQLTSDIVWLVERDVKLADGTTQKVLAPQLYLAPRNGDLSPTGALLSADALHLNLSGDVTNAGTVAGRQIVQLAANNVSNLGTIRADAVSVTAQTDINNQGGRIEADNRLDLQAGQDIAIATTTRTQSTSQGSRTNIDRVAGLYVTGSNGTLNAVAGRDLTLDGAEVINSGSGPTTLAATGNLTLGTVTEREEQAIVFDPRNHLKTTRTTDIGTQIQSAGDLSLQAGKDLTAKAADLQSNGNVALSAGNDVSILAGQRTETIDEATYHERKDKRPGFGFSIAKELVATGRSTSSRLILDRQEVVGSRIEGENIVVQAARDVNLAAAKLRAQNGLGMSAGRDLNIVSAEQTLNSQRQSEKILTSGPFGRKGLKETLDIKQVQQVGSTLSGGTIDLLANNDLTLSASTLEASGSVRLTAGHDINYLAATNLDERRESREKKNNLLNAENISGLLDNGWQRDTAKRETSRSTRTAAITAVQSEADVLSQSGGNTTLQGTRIRAGSFTASAGQIDGETIDPNAKLILAGVKESTTTSHTESAHSFMWQTMAGQGGTNETLKMPEILLIAPGMESSTVNRKNDPNSESAPKPRFTATGGIVVDAVSLPGTAQEAKNATATPSGGSNAPAMTTVDLKAQAHELAKQPGMAWLEDLTKRTDVDWKTVKLVHDNWDYKHSGLTPEGGIVVAIVVTILTWGAASGAGAALAEGAGMTTAAGTAGASTVVVAGTEGALVLTTTGATVATVTSAALTTLASQAAVSLINNKGDVGKTLKDLGSDENVKQLLVSMLTAGTLQAVGGTSWVSSVSKSTGLSERLVSNLTSAVVRSGIQSVVYNKPLDQVLKTELIASLAQSLTSEIGDWDKKYDLKPGSAAKILAHAVVQCAAASVQGNDCGAAALGAAAAEALSPLSNKADQSELSANLKLKGQLGNAIVSLSTLLAATLTGKDMATAMSAAQTVDYFNRQLHPAENQALRAAAKQLVVDKANGRELSPEQQRQLENYWFDQLESEAKAKVDAKAASIRQKYLADIAATNQPGYIGGASNYLNDAALARQIVSGMSGDVIYGQNGQPITADGSVLRAFEASATQYADNKLFLAKDSAQLIKQFGSLEAANNAQARQASWENTANANGTNNRNDSLLKAYQNSSEGVEAVAPETYVIGTGGVARALVKAATDAGKIALFVGGKDVIPALVSGETKVVGNAGATAANGAGLGAKGGAGAVVDGEMGGQYGSRVTIQKQSTQELLALENETNAHYLAKHGDQVTIQQLETRATTGIAPDGTKGVKVDSTRWLNNDDMLTAIRDAQQKLSTGEYEVLKDGSRQVTLVYPNAIGDGVLKGKSAQAGYFQTNTAVVRFPVNGKTPYTAYPKK